MKHSSLHQLLMAVPMKGWVEILSPSTCCNEFIDLDPLISPPTLSSCPGTAPAFTGHCTLSLHGNSPALDCYRPKKKRKGGGKRAKLHSKANKEHDSVKNIFQSTAVLSQAIKRD